MRFFVTIAGREHEVDLTGETPVVDGQAVAAELRALPDASVRHLLVDGRSHPVVLNPGDTRGQWDVHIAGRRYTAEVVDERTRTIRSLTGAAEAPRGPRPVKAPMPGLVVRVDVEVGQRVRAGQGLIIVEAMKMENELKADSAGVVSVLHVEAGQPVEKGTLLVEFETD